MDREWNDSQPIYRQLRDRVVALILDRVLSEGDPLPSVRHVAAEYRLNPITVLKAYQELVDEELVETKRGRGMFIKPGARNLLLEGERQKFLADEPTGNLDSKNAQLIMDLLGELHQNGSTIVMVTHDPRFAERAGRQVSLFDGKIVDDRRLHAGT